MTEPQAPPSMTQAGRTCPVCKGAGKLGGRSLYPLGEPTLIPNDFVIIQCNECGGIGQVPAEPDVLAAAHKYAKALLTEAEARGNKNGGDDILQRYPRWAEELVSTFLAGAAMPARYQELLVALKDTAERLHAVSTSPLHGGGFPTCTHSRCQANRAAIQRAESPDLSGAEAQR